MSSENKLFYEFGPFIMDVAGRRLLRGGRAVRLTPKVYDTLLMLVENCGRTLPKDELIRRLWPDSFVEESSLSQNIFLLRKVLGGVHRSEQQYIATISKCGYCFVADVRATRDAGKDLTLRERTGALAPIEDSHGALPIRSLAVLPFKPLGADRKNEMLGLGMADALILKLNNLQQIKVLPTSAIFKYTQRKYDSLSVGRELCVDAVLDGTVQHVDNQVRVTVQLLSIYNQRTLWSGKFDELFTDIFFVQDSISTQVAEAMATRITGDERRRLSKRYTNDAEAYQTYLLGLYFWSKGTKEGFDKAIEYLQQTIKKDPDYALAYAGLADCYFMRSTIEPNAPSSMGATYEKVRVMALKALELDATLAEAHTALAVVKVKHDRNPAGAEESFECAVRVNANCAMAYLRYAYFLAAMGRLDDALLKAKRAQELDPVSPQNNFCLGEMLYFSRRYDQALFFFQRSLVIEPNYLLARLSLGLSYEQKGSYKEAIQEFQKAADFHSESAEPLELLGHTYAVMGRKDEARRVLVELQESSGQKEILPYYLAAIYAALGETPRAFELLEQPCVDWTKRLRALRFDPRLDVLRSDRRFEKLDAPASNLPRGFWNGA
jgi:DNA-binding winged helix-turn-helix (wHTH) protein/tetratricopeptide (TPR) repeat protein